ncbi:class I SAM-dependent rRNA methyltransferase [Planctomicrobium piriforme]|uniref:23S rRNA (Cytosine1962-C5)-methyltransferase n=1 Tax=Planctomicrobium piriforme TaxID=1576369 RepID=A0A1I3HFN0_9PLAN|nr:class I SAM-dependent rRNA methyltransferase [Planctomicrobium piriforme]SFI34514.1 23S rRNA (cytosine1962-C5)-methyltransferase [Planctomicrobium piriforme]
MTKPYSKNRTDYRNRERPDNRHPSAKRRDRDTKFPLDPSLLVQRGLESPAADDLPVVQLKSETRHPTVYRKRIAEVDPRAKHGDLVRVMALSGEQIGYGLWNPRAEATVRILSWNEPPTTEAWWRDRIDMAVRLRKLMHLEDTTTAYRVLHAEGDGLPGLVVDRYENVLSLEAFTLGMYQRSEAIAKALAASLHLRDWIVRPGPGTLDQEGFLADGFASPGAAQRVLVREHGVTFEINPAEGHKTGFFCDQRENRQRLREFCRGKSVLDLCCYSGGFAINAALAGASEVTAVDLDEEAIKLARRNAQLNKANIKFVHADAFSYMRDMQRNGKTFDVVILDPPKLMRSREEAADGQSKYFDLNKLAAPLVESGGLLLTCSCSGLFSMDEFTRTVRAACGERRPQLLLRSGAGPDHPVSLGCLESEYLKCLWLRMD